MVAAFIDSVFVRKDVQQSLQTAANLLLMFLWEIFMIFPEKRWMHYVPSYIQDFLAAGLFMGSFGGAYMDLYYSFPAYDLVMHSVGGVLCTFVGYEILVCMQKRDKVKVDLPIVIFGAFGISFFAGTAWELFGKSKRPGGSADRRRSALVACSCRKGGGRARHRPAECHSRKRSNALCTY